MLLRLLFFSLFVQSLSFATPLLIKNATVWDPSLENGVLTNVIIEKGKIKDVTETPPTFFLGKTLDLKGHWLIPGLNDLHVHAHGNGSPTGVFHSLGLLGSQKSALYAGVTATLDLFNEENAIFGLRGDQHQGKIGNRAPLADLYAAGPIFTSTGGHGTEYGMFTRTIDTPEQAELEIRALAYKKPDVIKIVYDHAANWFTTLTKPTLKRAIEVARELKIKTVVHIGTWEDAETAIDYGASAITHNHNTIIPHHIVEKFVKHNVAWIPTNTVEMDLASMDEKPSLLENPLLKEMVPQSLLDSYRKSELFPVKAKAFLQWQKKNYTNFQQNTLRLANAGVKVITGTDAANMGTFQGYSVHRELELFVLSGMSNRAALEAATTNACAFLGKNCFIKKGTEASFVALTESPLKNISNTQKIEYVVLHGEVIDRAALRKEIPQKMLSESN